MKKLILSISLLVGLGVYSFGSGFTESSSGDALPVEYGGLRVSTSNFSLNGATIAGAAVINSVCFSTGSVAEFVEILQTTSTVSQGVGGIWTYARVYNVGVATANNDGATSRTGCIDAGKFYVSPNWFWRASVATYNSLKVLYEPK